MTLSAECSVLTCLGGVITEAAPDNQGKVTAHRPEYS